MCKLLTCIRLSRNHRASRHNHVFYFFTSTGMAPNEHLLDKFSVSKETRTLGAEILRLAQVKTGPGSGRELPELRGGLPAASVLIACEQ